MDREQSLNGPSSRELIELLRSIAELYLELGDYTRALAALEQAREITRINDGLYSLYQVEIANRSIDILEQAGAFHESESLQDSILELALRNEGDARVPTIISSIADRQMDVVSKYLEQGAWSRTLARIDASDGTGWELENIEFMRRFAGKKTLKRHDAAIQELLTNGSYVIGDTMDARAELLETYALIDSVNDHNEAGERKVDSLDFGSADLQRDLALSAFRRARRLYSRAMQAALEADSQGSGEYIAIQQKLIDSYYFDLSQPELHPESITTVTSRRRHYRAEIYGTGTSVLEDRVVHMLSQSAPALDIASALMEVGDWHLLLGSDTRALETYQNAHALLMREDVPDESMEELFSPAVPEILADLASDDSVDFDPTRAYSGYIDVAVEMGRFGEAKDVDVLNASTGTPPRWKDGCGPIFSRLASGLASQTANRLAPTGSL